MSDMLIGSLIGALYSLEAGLFTEQLTQGSSVIDMPPPLCNVTVAYGSGWLILSFGPL